MTTALAEYLVEERHRKHERNRVRPEVSRVAVLILAGGLLGGCAGGPTTPDAVSVSGTWDATFEGIVQGAGTTQHSDFTMELSQSGTTVGGFLRFSPNFDAIDTPITAGRINRNRLTYTAVTSLGPGCEARVDAELIVDPLGTRLAGSQTQSTCEGTAVGQVTAVKRP